MNLDDLSPELRQKAKACNNAEELLQLAKDEGVEISGKELEAVSGGWSNESCVEDFYCSSHTSGNFG